MRHSLLVVTLASISAAGPLAQAPRAPSAGAHAPAMRVDGSRLARVDRLLQQYVDENRIAGAVALVLQNGEPVYEKAVGWRDKASGVRMTTDSLFRIASQTKAITSVAVLMLVEEGKIG